MQKTPVDGINIAPYKFFGCRGSGFSWLSDRAAVLSHHKLAGKKADFWDLGSAAPWQFAAITEIVNYVCWIGGHFSADTDRRALFACAWNALERTSARCWRVYSKDRTACRGLDACLA